MQNRAFTILGLGVILLACLFALLIVIPTCVLQRQIAKRQAENSLHMRYIHQSMVTYAQGNKGYFPGLLSTGSLNQEASDRLASAIDSPGTPQNRYASIHRMFRDDFIEARDLINPAEIDPNITLQTIQNANSSAVSDGIAGRRAISGSYAVLEYVGVSSGAVVGGPRSTLGIYEWKDSFNSDAVVLSDRELTTDSSKPRSVWSTNGWQGWVLCNDNHATFELTENSVGYTGIYGVMRGTGTLGRLFNGIKPSDPYHEPTAGDGRLIAD